MSFQLQYLDEKNQHLDINDFKELSDAIADAEKCQWARRFTIHGMGQTMRADLRGTDGKLIWLGMR